ncbi:glycosyltransferase [Chitinophaga sp. 22321]|uniref:Glycosyltransferase family 2 protein n=1 Tax=Chitinophaga hostae TaxID=2831022 RepID=A0ABS5J082_9BACT|nr:glycosyltransferase family 2 protein [Chitinophaga hostae]MBS0028604.1 glycosyltransferase family 2 protein [Chitinophaga hostae]
MEKGITIIICTYNGSLRIPETLAHVAGQQFSDGTKWEVIFADNASTDNSSFVAATEWEKFDSTATNFTLIKENTPGKIYALHQAIAIAKYEYFIICDDDNWLDPYYAQTMCKTLDSDPLIGAAGGQSTAVTNGKALPEWFPEAAADYAVGKQSAATGDITKREYLWGAGLGSRTSLYKKMYLHFPSLLVGRKGAALTAGEDSEYCQRLILAGYKLYYNSDLIFRHFIPDARLERAYRDGQLNGFQASDAILDKYRMAIRLHDKYKDGLFAKSVAIINTFFKSIFTKKEKYRNQLQLLLKKDNHNDQVISAIRKFMDGNA